MHIYVPLGAKYDYDVAREFAELIAHMVHERVPKITSILRLPAKRQGKVYTEIVPDCSKVTLQAIIRGHIAPDAVIHSDGWRGYDGLVDIGFDKHFRVHHGENEFANGERHINGIESFWSFAKRRLAKFNGVPAHTFYLHLKETEFRFNHRHDNLYHQILKLLRFNPL